MSGQSKLLGNYFKAVCKPQESSNSHSYIVILCSYRLQRVYSFYLLILQSIRIFRRNTRTNKNCLCIFLFFSLCCWYVAWNKDSAEDHFSVSMSHGTRIVKKTMISVGISHGTRIVQKTMISVQSSHESVTWSTKSCVVTRKHLIGTILVLVLGLSSMSYLIKCSF